MAQQSPNQTAPVQKQGNLFQRASALAPLAPYERAILKALTSLAALVPATGVTAAITWLFTLLHTYLPVQVVGIVEILLSALFLGLSKYFTAQGDAPIANLLAQASGQAQKDAGSQPPPLI